jgi:hypothetical protein
MKWVFADFDIKEITVSYRQSKQLNDLARAMIRAVGGTEQNASLPAHVDSAGVAPALAGARHRDTASLSAGWPIAFARSSASSANCRPPPSL